MGSLNRAKMEGLLKRLRSAATILENRPPHVHVARQDKYQGCCNPECQGHWGSGCYCCHHGRYDVVAKTLRGILNELGDALPPAPAESFQEEDVRRIVYEVLGVKKGEAVGTVWFGGNQSYQSLGKGIAKQAVATPWVLVDLREVRRIAGQKVR